MGARWVLLLRGINVNPSTRVAMADLREVVEAAGCSEVTTILQSGNVLVTSARRPAVASIEKALVERSGVRSHLQALPIEGFRRLVEANPLRDAGDDLSKLTITFLRDRVDPAAIERPSDDELEPERLVVTPDAVYQWHPAGILASQLKPAWWRQFGPAATTRNVRTVERILAAADSVKK